MSDLNMRKALWPLLWAVILTLLYKLGDNFVITHLIPTPTLVVVAMVYLTLGALIGLLINFLLCQTPLGRLVDQSYTSIRGVSGKAHMIAFFTGLLSAAATGFYLYAMTMLDPSLVIPLTSLAVVFISIMEAIRGNIQFKRIWFSLVVVLVGVAVASYTTIYANWAAVAGVLSLILIGNNGFTAIAEVISKDGIDDSDAVSFGFWRFFWLTIAGIMISIGLAAYLGLLTVYLTTLIATLASATFYYWVVPIMVIVFFAKASENKGIGLSNATTKNLVMSGVIVLSVFVTFAASILFPGLFVVTQSLSAFEWFLRIIGAAILACGIALLRK